MPDGRMTKKEQFDRKNFLFGIDGEVERAVERVKDAYRFSTRLGLGKLYVCFSGGKDSVAVYGVCKIASEQLGMALGDMCEFTYNVTGVDPPELVWFIRDKYPMVRRSMYERSLWQLILHKKFPPLRQARYCCQELKERGGFGRFVVTGVRWAESARRKNSRQAFEVFAKGKDPRVLNADNEEDRMALEHCVPKRKYICNPIVDWSDTTVWRFIVQEGLPYCELYDQGFGRLGCIGCPFGGKTNREKEFAKYPKFKDEYIRTFDRVVAVRKKDGLKCDWDSGAELFDWWLRGEKGESR